MFPCEECGKNYMTAHALKAHQRLHTGERLYTCDQCGKTFIYPSLLRAHSLVHTEEKPYDCEFCEKGFRSSLGLTAHLRTHLDEKPYSCDTCEKAFIHSSTLKAHMRVHTEENKWKESLKKHPQNHPNTDGESLKKSKGPQLVIPSVSSEGIPVVIHKRDQHKLIQNGSSSTATSENQTQRTPEKRDGEEKVHLADMKNENDIKTHITTEEVVYTLD